MSIFNKIKNAFNPKKNGVEKKFKEAGKKIEKAGKKIINKVDNKIIMPAEKFFKRSENIKILTDIILEFIGDEITITVGVVGNGISIKFNAKNKVKLIRDKVKKGRVDETILYELIPDSIAVSAGFDFGIEGGIEINNNAKENIKTIVEKFKRLKK